MAREIRGVSYYYATVQDQPGESYKLLTLLKELGINLLAFTAVPVGPARTQLALFPSEPSKLESEAKRANLILDGPHPAILVQGDDELGVLASIHQKLFAADINIYASSGVADGRGSYGYLIYVRSEDFNRAIETLAAE